MLQTDFAQRFEAALTAHYENEKHRLHEAIRYSLLGPGKRLRPKLAYLCSMASGEQSDEETWRQTLPAMMAVEMVHCYSLVHDDLPAMDNDDYRRGRLSCHKKYGEAMGILVGDALIADAFELLSTATNNPLLQMRELACAIGSRGMVLGQIEDLAASAVDTTWEQWSRIHALKTGRLFEAACVMGALAAGASGIVVEQWREFAAAFGIAFQLRDDLDDNAATLSILGRGRIETLLKEKVDLGCKIAIDLGSEELASELKKITG